MSIIVDAELDTSKLESKEQEWTGRIRKLNTEISMTNDHMVTVTRRVFSAIQSTIHVATATLRAFGIALPPAFDAVIGAISTTFLSLQAIATAYTIGGITAAFAIPVEIAAMGLAWFSAAVAIAGQQEANQKLDQSEQALRSLGYAFSGWGRVFEEWG
jgi:hypothetical protein